ncbi:MAG: hypothetical protein AAB250_15430, partial [Bdellovibrionota bacterium]
MSTPFATVTLQKCDDGFLGGGVGKFDDLHSDLRHFVDDSSVFACDTVEIVFVRGLLADDDDAAFCRLSSGVDRERGEEDS